MNPAPPVTTASSDCGFVMMRWLAPDRYRGGGGAGAPPGAPPRPPSPPRPAGDPTRYRGGSGQAAHRGPPARRTSLAGSDAIQSCGTGDDDHPDPSYVAAPSERPAPDPPSRIIVSHLASPVPPENILARRSKPD